MRYYDTLTRFERNGLTVIVDKTYEDTDPWDELSECFDDKKQLYADIESCKYDWFMLRVRVMFEGLELATEYCGGCLYEDAREVLTDGLADDLIGEAMDTAQKRIADLANKFTLKTWEVGMVDKEVA